MSDMQDYKSSPVRRAPAASSKPSPTCRRWTTTRIRKQVEYIVSKGWNPAIEHTEPENAIEHYWYMWKLPMFGETDVDRILGEAEACHKAHPNNHVRLRRLRQLRPVARAPRW